MKNVKRIMAIILCVAMVFSVSINDLLLTFAGDEASSTEIPSATKTYAFDSEAAVTSFLSDTSVSKSYEEENTPVWDGDNSGLKLNKVTNKQTATVFVPNAKTDGENTYPVNGLQGRIQLGYAVGYHGALFLYEKVSDTQYKGNVVHVYNDNGFILYFSKVTVTETDGVFAGTIANANASYTKKIPAAELMTYNLDGLSDSQKEALVTYLTELDTDKTKVNEAINNRWVDFELHFSGNTPYLKIAMTMNSTVYSFDVPMYGTVATSSEKMFGVGALNSSKQPDATRMGRQSILLDSFTVSYDLTDYYQEYVEEIEEKIATVGAITADKLDDLNEIYSDYQQLPEELQGYVQGIDSVKNALAAFESGAYFYDDFERGLNWQLAGRTTDETLTPTNTYSEAAISNEGDEDGNAFWGIHSATDDSENHVLWLRKAFNTNVVPTSNNNNNKPSVIAITKDVLPDDARISSVSGKMYLKNYGYGSAAYKQFTGLAFSYTSEYQWSAVGHGGSSAGVAINGVVRTSQTSGKRKAPTYTVMEGVGLATELDLKWNQWVDFVLEFDYVLGCYTYTVSGLSSEEETTTYKIKLDDATQLMPEVGLVNATPCAQSFDDITVTLLGCSYVEKLIEQLPQPEAVTLEHEEQILVLKQVFKQLWDAEKEKISAELLEKYENVLIAYERLLQDQDSTYRANALITFEEDEPGIEYFESVNEVSYSNWEVIENPSKEDVNNTSDKVLKITRNYADVLEKDNNRAVYKIKDTIMDGTEMLSNFSGKVYLDTSSTTTVIYNYTDETHWQGYQLAIGSSGNVTVKKVVKNGTGTLKIDSKATALVLETTDSVSLAKTGVWIDFNVEYEFLKAQLTIGFSKDGKSYTGQYVSLQALLDTCATKVGFATGSTAYVDDVKVNFESDSNCALAQKYIEKYAYLLKLSPVETYLSVADEKEVKSLLNDYETLTDEVKCFIPFIDIKVENIKAAYENLDFDSKTAERDLELLEYKEQAPSGVTDFVFEDNFDYGATAWMPAKTQLLNTGSVEVVDVADDDVAKKAGFTGKVLKADGISAITPKSTLLPNKAQIISLSYRIYRVNPTDDYYRLFLFGKWTGDDDISGIGLKENNICYMSGGLLKSFNRSGRDTQYLDLAHALNVTIDYTSDGKYSVSFRDSNGTTLYTKAYNGNITSLAVVGAFNGTTYIDDVKIVYCEGDYDVDEENQDITVYYSGNTFQTAGDYVTLYGENLADNVSKVWIAPITNATTGDRSFVSQESYDSIGAQDGEYTKNPVAHQFDENLAVEVPIVQSTVDSLKFMIPNEFADGSAPQQAVYAIKLIGADGEEKVIYMNEPSIDYAVGSDGEICTPGTEVRLIGENLAPTGKISDLKALFVSETGDAYEASVTEIQSDYSVSVQVPQTLDTGKKYEIWFHSGLGDYTTWTVPAVVTVDVGVRDTWNNTVYNLQTDFGATGSEVQNATPCFVNAFATMDANDGGVLYIPDGTYIIDSELIIPENCRIIGESMEKTALVIRPYNWSYNHMPAAIFNFTSNVEIKNLRILGTRVSGLFSAKGENSDNIYLEDIYVLLQPYAASVTQGSNGLFEWLEDNTVLIGKIKTETVQTLLSIGTSSNVQIRNVDLGTTEGQQKPLVDYSSPKQYWQVEEFTCDKHIASYTSNSIWENCSFGDGAVGIWGSGCYFQNCSFSSNTTNNRELYVADHGPKYTGTIEPYDNGTGCSYVLGTADLCYNGAQLYLKSGQGAGQIRTVVSSYNKVIDGTRRTIVTLDEPYYVEPNRNSQVVLRLAREDIYFIGNTYYNGSAGGFYGGAADVIYEDCSFDMVSNIYQNAHIKDVNWYFSYVNCTTKYRTALSSIGVAATNKAFDFISGDYTNGQLCFLVKNCSFDGMYNRMYASGLEALRNVTIQNCEWTDIEYAIQFYDYEYSSGKYENIDGVLMVDNRYIDVDYVFDPDNLDIAEALLNTTNTSGSRRLVVLDEEMGEVERGVLGDVTGDHIVDLKDATMISQLVVGKTTFTESQLLNGDVNGDGCVDLKDASLIKFYVVGKIAIFPAEEQKGESEES